MKIGREDRDRLAPERVAGEERPQRARELVHAGERLHAIDLMREYRARTGTKAERDLAPRRELGDRRETHREIDRVAEIRHGDRRAELHLHARDERGGGGDDTAVFEIVVGPDLCEAESSQGFARAL